LSATIVHVSLMGGGNGAVSGVIDEMTRNRVIPIWAKIGPGGVREIIMHV